MQSTPGPEMNPTGGGSGSPPRHLRWSPSTCTRFAPWDR